MAYLLGVGGTASADQDLQLWFPNQIVHPLTDDLTISMQVEGRFQDDISKFSQLVLKPALNYHFDEHWGLSAGYKFIEKYEQPNEHDPWQEVIYSELYGDLMVKYQVRFEPRLITGMDGVLPRIRSLVDLAHPIGDSPHYLASWGAVRFNLDDKGEARFPASSRSGGGLGLGTHLNRHAQFEMGYLYRYEREWTGDPLSDHAIQMHFVLNTGAKKSAKPRARDKYR